MSNTIEKLNHPGNEEIKRVREYSDPSSNKVKMFVCEKHETLWIKPSQNRVMVK